MSWSLVQYQNSYSIGGDSSSGGTSTVTRSPTSLPTVGNLLVIVIAVNADDLGLLLSVGDNQGNTYTQAAGETSDNYGVVIFYSEVTTAAGSFDISMVASAGAAINFEWAWLIAEYSGLETSSPVDQAVSTWTPGGVDGALTATVSISPTLGSLVIGAAAGANTTQLTAPSGWSSLASLFSPSAQSLDVQQRSGAGTSLTPAWTIAMNAADAPFGALKAVAASFLMLGGSTPPMAGFGTTTSLAAAGTVTIFAAATLADTSSVMADGQVNILSVPLAATTSLRAEPTVTIFGAASLAATTSLAAAGLVDVHPTQLVATTTLLAAGTVTIFGNAAMASDSSLAADGRVTPPSATLVASTSLFADGRVNVLSAGMVASTTLTAVGTVNTFSSAAMVATTSLAAAGVVTVVGSDLAYQIFENDGLGGAIDYTAVIATTAGLSWATPPLSAGTWKFGVRTIDTTTLLGDRNLDAAVTILIAGDGSDGTNRPLPPRLVTAIPGAPGAIAVSWFYPTSAARLPTKPTGFKVYLGTPTVSFSSPAATIAYLATGSFRATVSGLTAGSPYQLVVRAYNAAGDDGNTNVVTVTPVAGGPSGVTGLAATLVNQP
jgi:hypothetical protein